MQIHELNNFTGTLGAGAYLAVDDGSDTGKLSTQQLLSTTESEISALDTRIDNIVGGVTVFVTNANAETVLINSSAKDHIRFIVLEDISINAIKTISNMNYCKLESYGKCKFSINHGGVVFENCGYNVIQNISFEGDGIVTGTPPFSYVWSAGTCENVVTLHDSRRNYFENCSFDNGKINILLENSYVNTFNNCMIRDASNIGIYAKYDESYQPQINFNNCFINRNKNAGAYIKTGEVYFYGCVFQFNGSHAIFDSGSAVIFNIGVLNCDLENSANSDFVLRGANDIRNIIIENNTLANDASNIIEIFNVANLTNPASTIIFKSNEICQKKICTDVTKFDATCFFDNTGFPLPYQLFMKCRGIFKTSGVQIPTIIFTGTRAVYFPIVGRYIKGTITLVFSEAVGSVYVATRAGNKTFSTSDNLTYTLDIDEPLEGILFIDFLTTSHTSTLSSAMFAGTYER